MPGVVATGGAESASLFAACTNQRLSIVEGNAVRQCLGLDWG